MKNKTRRHIWPVSLVMSLAIIGALAAIVVLAANPGGTQAHPGGDDHAAACADMTDAQREAHNAAALLDGEETCGTDGNGGTGDNGGNGGGGNGGTGGNGDDGTALARSALPSPAVSWPLRLRAGRLSWRGVPSQGPPATRSGTGTATWPGRRRPRQSRCPLTR